MVFSGGFVYHMLLRQLECRDETVMEFEFNGVGARFDRKAFAMITGLNCGKYPADSELQGLPYTLWNKYFGDSGPLSFSQFVKRFDEIEFSEDSPKEIANNVKCCMFYFLKTVLLPKDRLKIVKSDHFNIIAKDDLCQKYPWGNLCYD